MIAVLTITEWHRLIAYTSYFKVCNKQVEYSTIITVSILYPLDIYLKRKLKTLWETKIDKKRQKHLNESKYI